MLICCCTLSWAARDLKLCACVLCRAAAAALSASEGCADADPEAAQPINHTSAPAFSCSSPNGRRSKMQVSQEESPGKLVSF